VLVGMRIRIRWITSECTKQWDYKSTLTSTLTGGYLGDDRSEGTGFPFQALMGLIGGGGEGHVSSAP